MSHKELEALANEINAVTGKSYGAYRICDCVVIVSSIHGIEGRVFIVDGLLELRAWDDKGAFKRGNEATILAEVKERFKV